ncbi:DUF2304 domain-containing protein [Chitiniphilus purpureus]|uniref:DUF2304 domain-containing protein n=1 Tax=Chitiniphilus purpureus TaxID=2981137 RepID=A0ABY6DUJ3_9NEIS|nr:DUF2304 domain-containing protein [Chitiniphilus sp. CD1]UXY15538.1 DUF2304 domain-containing protein [Chitiniphilus sp. CD1]
MAVLLVAFFLFLIVFCLIQRKSFKVIPDLGVFFSVTAIILVLKPDFATDVANKVGVGRGTDLLLYCFFIVGVLLALFVGLYLKKVHDQLTELARKLALLDVKKGKI